MIETLKHIDYFIFQFINQQLHVDELNPIFITLRNPTFLRWLYLLIAFFLIAKFRLKGFYALLFLAASMGLSDLISSHVLKPNIHRLRPCMDAIWHGKNYILVNCPNGFSFTSSHAANNMSVWFLLLLFFATHFKNYKYTMLVLPLLIGFSQIYVGVHYPFDVAGGYIVGFFCGYLMFRFYKYIMPIKWQL